MSGVKHVNTVRISGSRHVPFFLTRTMHTCSELMPAVVERCSSQVSSETVTPAKCAPLELSLSSCSMWPQHRTAPFSLSVWLLVDSDQELSASRDGYSISSLSTIDLNFVPAGAFQLSARCRL